MPQRELTGGAVDGVSVSASAVSVVAAATVVVFLGLTISSLAGQAMSSFAPLSRSNCSKLPPCLSSRCSA